VDSSPARGGDGPHGEALAQITTEIVRLYSEYYGRGPTRAKSYMLDEGFRAARFSPCVSISAAAPALSLLDTRARCEARILAVGIRCSPTSPTSASTARRPNLNRESPRDVPSHGPPAA
jgi:hypothetical protein